jgi:choline-sulfatase
MRQHEGIRRRDLLKSAAVAPLVGLASRARAASPKPPSGVPRNVVLFMTDQERAIQHFPAGWEEANLPGLTRLKKNGLSFNNAFTDACMCSPARSTWMTGYFPAQHGVKYTLEEDMPARQYPQVELPMNLHKGKWHCSKPHGKHWVPKDVNQYGLTRWNPQDAGANQNLDEAGGGIANNDGRFMNDDGQFHAGREGALTYLNSVAASQQPFFMIISLVNPHDVLFYPNNYLAAGYDSSWLVGDIQIPETNSENLFMKPTAQREFLKISDALGLLDTDQKRLDYLNFYGNLMISSDNYLVQVLDALENNGLLDDTLVIRTADHGEMGLTHNGQRQKNFNFYEESIRIPLVYSNPRLFETPRVSDALVSHVDFLPTIASFFHAPVKARANWQGVAYSNLLLDPTAEPVQDYIVFTYDDFQSGQKSGPYPFPPNHIVSIREARYKLAEYYGVEGHAASQWEMYDLLQDPLETNNLAFDIESQHPGIKAEYQRLQAKLNAVKLQRLQPL